MTVKTGYDPDRPGRPAFPEGDDIIRAEVEEVGRVEIRLVPANGRKARRPSYAGACLVAGESRPLPPGSTFDSDSGTFVWQLGPGFIGPYDFVFVDEVAGAATKISILVVPKRK